MDGTSWKVNSKNTKENFLKHVDELFEKHGYVTFSWETGKQRTKKQNNSLHLWLSQLAKMLNDAGLDMKKTLKAETEIPWTMISAKEHLWKPIQQIVIGKESTAEAQRKDYNEIYAVLSRHFSEKHGIQVPEWPSIND